MADHLKEKKIGLFGGTFNPIHIGHLNFACELREKGGLDEIWFIPTALSPFKQKDKIPSPSLRAHMIALAIGDTPFFRLYQEEILRGGISYTIDTLEILLKQKKEFETFYLCLTEDLMSRFTEWKEYQKILSLVPLLVGIKKERVGLVKEQFSEILCPVTLFEISATQIRARLKQRVYCDHLVPQKVLDFIYENQLYFNE